MSEQIIKPEFNRTSTKAIKGVAVVLMLFHHLAGIPARFPIDFLGFESAWAPFIENGYLQEFALAAKICVSLFFFLGGYGFFIRRKVSRISVVSEIIRLYKAYWKVFIIFVPIGIIFFANGKTELNDFCVRYVFGSGQRMITTVLSDFIGWTSMLNSEWWFIKSYICVTILGHLFCDCTEKNNSFWKDIFTVFVLDILIRSIFPSIAETEAFSRLGRNPYYKEFFAINGYSTAYFAGIVFAKYNGINWIIKKIQEIPYPATVSVLGFFALYWARTYVFYDGVDLICCALMIPMLSVFLDRCKIIKCIFVFLGKHSSNIWLIHSFYCYYFLEITHVVFITRNVWVDLLILVLLSLASSIMLEWFYSLIGRKLKKQCSA